MNPQSARRAIVWIGIIFSLFRGRMMSIHHGHLPPIGSRRSKKGYVKSKLPLQSSCVQHRQLDNNTVRFRTFKAFFYSATHFNKTPSKIFRKIIPRLTYSPTIQTSKQMSTYLPPSPFPLPAPRSISVSHCILQNATKNFYLGEISSVVSYQQ